MCRYRCALRRGAMGWLMDQINRFICWTNREPILKVAILSACLPCTPDTALYQCWPHAISLPEVDCAIGSLCRSVASCG